VQIPDDQAHTMVEEYIQKYGWKGAKKKKAKAETKRVSAPKRRGLKKAARKSA